MFNTSVSKAENLNLHSNIFKLILTLYYLLSIATIYLHSNIFKLIFERKTYRN